ncbi:hypothetical protein P7C71_g876, partial [Lecanoromycetidae sp. Uapishka_2]
MIFKNTGKRPGIAVRGKDAQAFSKSEKASKAMKEKKQHELKQRPEHPLAAAFSDTIEGSRDALLDQATADIELARAELEQRLSKSDEHYRQLDEDTVHLTQALAVPFQTQELEWTSHDGKQSGSTTLSIRMKRLQKTIEAQERELALQQAEWSAVQTEIFDMLKGMMSPGDFEQWLSGNGDIGTVGHGTVEKAELEVMAEKEWLMAEIGKLEKDSMKKMKESEKKLQLKEREMQQSFMAMLADDDY